MYDWISELPQMAAESGSMVNEAVSLMPMDALEMPDAGGGFDPMSLLKMMGAPGGVNFSAQGKNFGFGFGPNVAAQNAGKAGQSAGDTMMAKLLEKYLADDKESPTTSKVAQPVSPINTPITPIQPMRVGPTLPPPGMSPYGGGMVGNWMGNLTGGPLRP